MFAAVRHLAIVAHSLVREAVKRVARSPKWRAVEKAHLRDEPVCAACGGKKLLQVHHVVAFAEDAAKELDPTNLITLCMATRDHHHLDVGHGGSFRRVNPRSRVDAMDYREAKSPAERADVLARARTASMKHPI